MAYQMLMYGSFESRDVGGALADADTVTVNVYVGASASPDSVLSAQASSYIKRGTGLYSFQIDAGPYPAQTTFLVDVVADVAGTLTETTVKLVRPGLTPEDLDNIRKMSSGYWQGPCSPCNPY